MAQEISGLTGEAGRGSAQEYTSEGEAPGELEAIRKATAAWRAGTALAGCSAGACALSYVAEDMRAMGARRALRSPRMIEPTGLATIPEIAVIPHFDRMARWAPHLAGRYASRVPDGVTVIGVDEDTAIVTEDSPASVPGERRFAVAGRQSAWVLDRDGGRREHPSGSTLTVSVAEG